VDFSLVRTHGKLCGIAGFTHKSWTPPPERIREAVHTLHHRGPDQQGIYSSIDFSVAAARLKIIDLATGDQPLMLSEGTTGIVFNGEIYNYAELREELESLGHKFTTHSDTETVLRAFLQWDKECLRRLRGMFAFAIWEAPAKRILLARDRLGIKPLYIAIQGEELFFGSELKAVLVHPEIKRTLSLAGLDCYLATNYVASPWTLVESVKKLPAGCWLEWQDGKTRSDSYWSLPRGTPRDMSLQAATEELDSLLKSAVREHLISDVPLGIWLSGGIDSTTILHYAAAECPAKLNTFSISFRGRSFDESRYIASAVKQYGTRHEEFDLNPEADLCGAIEEFAYYSDEPCADAGALPVWFLSKLCKRRVTVALSGEGADELFAGYLTYRADQIAQTVRRLPQGLLRAAGALAHRWPVSDEKISFEYKLKRLLEGAPMSPMRAHLYWNGTFAEKEERALLKAPVPDALNEILSKVPGQTRRDASMAEFLWFDQKYYLTDDILTKSDRMSMAHSVELRPPFLDHRLVEFAARLPVSLKIRGRRQKVVLKELMRHKLPREILRRKKVGFDIPAHEWLRGPLRGLLHEALQFGMREYGELFDAAAIQRLVELHDERQINVGYQLWGLLILFQWMKRWNIQAVEPARQQAAPLLVVGVPG
jgi:asparagine synthase (glutamine-hydrolysing)